MLIAVPNGMLAPITNWPAAIAGDPRLVTPVIFRLPFVALPDTTVDFGHTTLMFEALTVAAADSVIDVFATKLDIIVPGGIPTPTRGAPGKAPVVSVTEMVVVEFKVANWELYPGNIECLVALQLPGVGAQEFNSAKMVDGAPPL